MIYELFFKCFKLTTKAVTWLATKMANVVLEEASMRLDWMDNCYDAGWSYE